MIRAGLLSVRLRLLACVACAQRSKHASLGLGWPAARQRPARRGQGLGRLGLALLLVDVVGVIDTQADLL